MKSVKVYNTIYISIYFPKIQTYQNIIKVAGYNNISEMLFNVVSWLQVLSSIHVIASFELSFSPLSNLVSTV